MKRKLKVLLILISMVMSLSFVTAAAGQGLWTWEGGDEQVAELESFGSFGTKGTADPLNVPSARSSAASAYDSSGHLWVFGGQGYDANGNRSRLNDLWKWDGTNWTWIGGSNSANQYGVYGTKGSPASTNVPGGRYNAVAWTDSSGYFYVFGGYGCGASGGFGSLNDLWRWDGTNWTWLSGSNTISQYGIYGTKGVPNAANVPGSRFGAVSWTDSSGNFYLFGGYGYGASGGLGSLNDLWRWDGTNWTWISGSNTINQYGVYGTKGVPDALSVPGSRYYSASWTDTSGNFYLFGGNGNSSSTTGSLNDLWRWDGTNWTWISGSNTINQFGVYGTKGNANALNVPGGRYGAVSWRGSSGDFYLFGGFGYGLSGGNEILNDLWKWDGANWTWISGSNITKQPGNYGTKGDASATNVPGSRQNAVAGRDASGNLLLFGGTGVDLIAGSNVDLNDLWKWDGTNWTWLSGSDMPVLPGSYGTKGVAAPTNVPGARFDVAYAKAPSGDLWVFGGQGYDASGSSTPSLLNDLWRWDGANWTWVSGSNTGRQYGVYGTMGFASPSNIPGSRYDAMSWTDSEGNYYLFGGFGYAVSGGSSRLNDLWRWDGTNWTWIGGSSTTNQTGVYGTKGVGHASNIPGARYGAASWIDSLGNYYLFGGYGYGASGTAGNLNDLWRWDGVKWTWLSGSNTADQTGIYGTKGIADPANIPGGRYGAASWIDSLGNYYLFGGYGYGVSSIGRLNDLWKWDGTNWTWIGGSNTTNQTGVYGTKGVADAANIPGARYVAAAWTHSSGNVYMFGGNGYAASGGFGDLNDLWKWDGANWTWIGGSNTTGRTGVYGTKGVADALNDPGGRSSAVSWTENSGRLMLFGGARPGIVYHGTYNDLWSFFEPSVPTVTTETVTDIHSTIASSGGDITSDGGLSVTARGVCWSAALNPTTEDSCTNDGTGTGPFTSSLTGLTPNTTYHVRAYATNSLGTSYGGNVQFTTAAPGAAPTVTTAVVENIYSTIASSGGDITSDGGLSATARGVCRSTTPNPTILDACTNDGTGTGPFTSSLTGLTPNTIYHVRAYATNSLDTSYGDDVQFMTDPPGPAPTVTTTAITNISSTTAGSGGNVTSDGGTEVYDRGTCYGTSQNPTTGDSCTHDGTGTGAFTSSLTGLTSGQTYHVRAYATNSGDTAYGSDLSFITPCGSALARFSDTDYGSLQDAATVASGGGLIKVNTATFGSAVFANTSPIELRGGHNCGFTEVVSVSTVSGSITLGGSGSVEISNVVIR